MFSSRFRVLPRRVVSSLRFRKLSYVSSDLRAVVLWSAERKNAVNAWRRSVATRETPSEANFSPKKFRKNFSWAQTGRLASAAIPTSSIKLGELCRVGGTERANSNRKTTRNGEKMSSPKKIGRWNRFEIAFNEGVWPKPSFWPSAPSRASDKTRSLRKIEKETPDAPFADLAPSAETPDKPSPENKTPTEPTSEEKPPIPNAAELKETPIPNAAKSPTLWAEARQRAAKAKKRRF